MKKPYSYSYDNNPNISGSSVPFAVVEAYKTIRTNVLFLLSQCEKKTFAVTSALQGEGKSTTSVNIAIAFSQLGHKVLLIDGDLRKASVHKKLKISNELGVTSVLANFCTLEEAIKEVNPNLSVLTTGPIPPNASELLSSEAMSNLLTKLESIYDYIIIDTPPVNIVSDALVIGAKVAGVLMVVKDCCLSHDEFKRALNAIQFANLNLFGVVLNGSNGRGGRGYRYKYRYRYSYKYKNYNYNYNYRYGGNYGYGYGYGYGNNSGKPKNDKDK